MVVSETAIIFHLNITGESNMKGWKTWVGTIGFAVCNGVAQLLPDYAEVLQFVGNYIFAPLGVVGVAHKIEKSSGAA